MHLDSQTLTMRGTALLRPVASPLTFDMRDQDLPCRLLLTAAGMNSKRTVRSFVGAFLISLSLSFFLFFFAEIAIACCYKTHIKSDSKKLDMSEAPYDVFGPSNICGLLNETDRIALACFHKCHTLIG